MKGQDMTTWHDVTQSHTDTAFYSYGYKYVHNFCVPGEYCDQPPETSPYQHLSQQVEAGEGEWGSQDQPASSLARDYQERLRNRPPEVILTQAEVTERRGKSQAATSKDGRSGEDAE